MHTCQISSSSSRIDNKKHFLESRATRENKVNNSGYSSRFTQAFKQSILLSWLYGKREQGQLESLFEKADVHLRLSLHSERVSERTPVNIHNERRSQAESFHSENLTVNCIFISIFFCEQSIQFGNANTGYQFLPRKLVVLLSSLLTAPFHFYYLDTTAKSCGKNNEEISGLVNFKNHDLSDFVFVGEIRCSTGHRRAKRSAWTQFGKF